MAVAYFKNLFILYVKTGLPFAYAKSINEITSEALLWFNQRQTTLLA